MKRRNKLLSLLLIVVIFFNVLPSITFAAASKIVSNNNLSTSVYLNQSYTLPKTIDATMNNKSTQKVVITWNPNTAVTSKIGTFVYKGTVKGYDQKILLTLKVIPLPEEVDRAISYGFVPKEIQSDLGATINFSQYCTMLSKMISLYKKSYVLDFNKYTELAFTSKDPMKREDGMLAIYYAALSMKLGTSENNFTNGNWQKIHQLCGERAWDDFSGNYPLFPSWNKKTNIFNGNYVSNAYFFAMAQYSSINGKTLFDFDEKNKTMHVNQSFTREAAICSVARLYESVMKFEPVERAQTQWDEEFFKLYDNRLNEILNSETAIMKSQDFIPGKTYTGTAYYISPSGDDDNDGLSPERPWATVTRTYGHLQKGDAVFFERGGIWREELQCSEGITYSAYGNGNKPCFYGSQENGADSEKWTLWYEDKSGKKIWKFNKDVSDCGGIVFNDGKSHANRVFSYWNGSKYVYTDNKNKTFDIAQGLEYDLQFYSTFNPSKYKMTIYVYDIDSRGPLYLRCDTGNPGKVYDSIEFQTAPRPEAGYCGIIKADQGCILDNLCVKYGISRGIATHNNSNVIIQNCEVGWIGGGTHELNGSGYIPVSGEGIGIEGSNNIAENNYVHDCFDGGIISELGEDFPFYVQNQAIIENVIERCISGILVASHKTNNLSKPSFGDITIADNMILYSGYGWSCDKHYDFTWGDKVYNGNAITFWDTPNINKGIIVKNNTLYLAKSGLVHLSMDKKYWPIFEGNSYIQNQYGIVGFLGIKYGTSVKGSEMIKFVKEVMGDKTAKVIEPN